MIKGVIAWFKATGLRNLLLLVVAALAYLLNGFDWIGWMCVGAFVWDNLRVIGNLFQDWADSIVEKL